MMKLNIFTKFVANFFVLALSFSIFSVHAQSGTSQAALNSYSFVSQQIYVAMLGRAAAPADLALLANSLNNIGAPTNIVDLNRAYDTNYQVRDLINGYGNGAEFQNWHAGSSGSFITNLYHDLFNRYPDSNGYEYWKSLVDNGSLTRGHAAIAIMAASYGNADWNVVSNKVNIAIAITKELDLNSEINIYHHAILSGYARYMLERITGPSNAKAAVEWMVNFYG